MSNGACRIAATRDALRTGCGGRRQDHINTSDQEVAELTLTSSSPKSVSACDEHRCTGRVRRSVQQPPKASSQASTEHSTATPNHAVLNSPTPNHPHDQEHGNQPPNQPTLTPHFRSHVEKYLLLPSPPFSYREDRTPSLFVRGAWDEYERFDMIRHAAAASLCRTGPGGVCSNCPNCFALPRVTGRTSPSSCQLISRKVVGFLLLLRRGERRWRARWNHILSGMGLRGDGWGRVELGGGGLV